MPASRPRRSTTRECGRWEVDFGRRGRVSVDRARRPRGATRRRAPARRGRADDWLHLLRLPQRREDAASLMGCKEESWRGSFDEFARKRAPRIWRAQARGGNLTPRLSQRQRARRVSGPRGEEHRGSIKQAARWPPTGRECALPESGPGLSDPIAPRSQSRQRSIAGTGCHTCWLDELVEDRLSLPGEARTGVVRSTARGPLAVWIKSGGVVSSRRL